MASDAQLTTDVLLGDVATFRSGSVFKPDEQGQRSGDIPFIKVSDLNLPSNSHKIEESNNWLTLQSAKRLGTTIHPAGATVFAKIGVALTYNRRRLLIRDTAIDNNLMSAIPNPSKIRPEFLYHTLRCLDFNEIAKGSALPYINIGDLKGLRVRLPSLPEQEEICSLLDALDDRIDLLRQTNATLEAIAQALFKCWFVDFDPVRAKAEGREPEGMDAATAELFPSDFGESELGLIPRGWKVLPLSEAFEINPRRAIKKGSVAPYLDMASVPTSGHVPAPPVDREFSSGSKFLNGDTLLARITPCLENGKTAHVDFLAHEQVGWGSTEFIVLRPKPPLPLYFGYLIARHDAFRAFAKQAMTGTSGRQRVELGQLERFQVVCPDAHVSTAFGLLVEPIRACISANQQRSEVLAKLRDILLPRLISGKLRLPQAEAVVETLA